MELAPTIKAVQAKLGLTADGVAGPLTWAAISKSIGAEPLPQTEPSDLDTRTENNIDTLLPVVRPLAHKLISELKAKGMEFRITSAYRTPSEQNELYEQGRSKPGKIVTNARAYYSNHNFALAFDITRFIDNMPVWEGASYDVAGAVGKSIGLLWGGDWATQDKPHFEYRPDWAKDMSENQALAEYRERAMNGSVLV